MDQTIQITDTKITGSKYRYSPYAGESTNAYQFFELVALSKTEQKTVLLDLMSTSTREADRKLAVHFPQQPPPEQTKPISSDITRIEFNSRAELTNKLERLKTVYHHQTGGQWEKLFDILADHELEKLDAPPRRARGIKLSPESSESPAANMLDLEVGNSVEPQSAESRSRHINKATHQQVWKNWERGCDHILNNGERCTSRQNLQRDHILEFSKGGDNSKQNLRLLCGAHNRYRSDAQEKLRLEFMERIESIRLICFEELKKAGGVGERLRS